MKWEPLSKEQEAFYRRLMGPSFIKAEQAKPSFYREGVLVRMKIGDDEAMIVETADGIKMLDGTGLKIMQINRIARLDLNDKSVNEYLWFFCLGVQGEHGPWHIVNADAPEKLGEVFKCVAHVVYGTHLFLCKFDVRGNGEVEMTEDRHLSGVPLGTPLFLQ